MFIPFSSIESQDGCFRGFIQRSKKRRKNFPWRKTSAEADMDRKELKSSRQFIREVQQGHSFQIGDNHVYTRLRENAEHATHFEDDTLVVTVNERFELTTFSSIEKCSPLDEETATKWKAKLV